MARLQYHLFRALSDNYSVLVHDPASGQTAVIDAPEVDAVEKALTEKGWSLSHILLTHHHGDHIDGVPALVEKWQAQVVGNRHDNTRLPQLDHELAPGDIYDFAGCAVEVIDTPGHTIGHIAYHFIEENVLFVGDTLFTLGCGRVFEGTMEEMWGSLSKLAALPPQTVVYCGHEYSLSNAKFCLSIEPDNAALQQRAKEIAALREANKPTVPTTIGAELETNVFVRAGSVEKFAEIRHAKDNF